MEKICLGIYSFKLNPKDLIKDIQTLQLPYRIRRNVHNKIVNRFDMSQDSIEGYVTINTYLDTVEAYKGNWPTEDVIQTELDDYSVIYICFNNYKKLMASIKLLGGTLYDPESDKYPITIDI